MKRSLYCLCWFFLLILLAGCRFEWNYSEPAEDEELKAAEEEEEEEEEEIVFISTDEQLEAMSVGESLDEAGQINTEIDIAGIIEGGTHMKLKGKSNLPEGALISVKLQEYQDRPVFTVENILQCEEPDGPVLVERDIAIQAGGEFNLTLVRKDKLNYSKLTVIFRPERQPETLQSIYGRFGENIKNQGEVNRITYSINGEDYTGYQGYAPIDILNAYSQLW